MQPDITAHRAHNLTADVEAQARAANLAGARGVESSKAPKETSTFLIRDAHALIADVHHDEWLALGGSDDCRLRCRWVMLWIVGLWREMRHHHRRPLLDGAADGRTAREPVVRRTGG